MCKYLFSDLASTKKYRPPKELRKKPTIPPQVEKEEKALKKKVNKKKRLEAQFVLTPEGLVVVRNGKEKRAKQKREPAQEEEEEEEENSEKEEEPALVQSLSHQKEVKKPSRVRKLVILSGGLRSSYAIFAITTNKLILVALVVSFFPFILEKKSHLDDEDEPEKPLYPKHPKEPKPNNTNKILHKIQEHSPFLNKLMSMSHEQLAQMAEEDEEYVVDRVADCVS